MFWDPLHLTCVVTLENKTWFGSEFCAEIRTESVLRPKLGLRRTVDRAQECLSWFGHVVHHNSDMILAIARARYSPLSHWDILAVKEIFVSNIFIRRCQEAHMWVKGETLEELKWDKNTIYCLGFFINHEQVLVRSKHLSLNCKVHFNLK